ncbi:MAG: hypothetical protein ACYDC6_08205 [Acidobacteriaceae bacterium]
MQRVLRNYVFWTYQRGSVHYDVMVTLILLFIFLSPRVINFKDKPVVRTLPPSQVLVKSDGHNGLSYRIDAATLDSFHDSGDLKSELRNVIQPISGDVAIDRYQPVKGPHGQIVAYKVWAHR